MRVTQDKFDECRYFLKKLNEAIKLINSETKFVVLVDKIFEFRYELNAFVNSFRATTFALQSEHKKSHGKIFDEWYAKSKNQLQGDEFSKIILELRNINQKEGNIFPTFEFIGEAENSNIYFELDFTNKKDQFVTKYRMISRFQGGQEYISTTPFIEEQGNDDNSINENILSEADKNLIFKEVMLEFKSKINELLENNQFKLHKLKIERFNKEYTPEQFMNNLERLKNLMSVIVKDGWEFLK